MAVVAHVTTLHLRDDVRIWQKECAVLAAGGARDVCLVVADGLGDETVDGIALRDVGRLPAGRLGRALAGSLRVFSVLREMRPDLVHFHDPELLPVCLLLRVMGYPVVYDAHEDLSTQLLVKPWLPAGLRRPAAVLVALLESSAARFCSAVVAATPQIAARFPQRRTTLVRNFPIVAEFPTGAPYGERPPAFAYVGVIAEIRGAMEMIEAAGLTTHPSLQLLLAGNYSPTALESALERLTGWESARYLGWLDRAGVVELLGRARGGLVVLHPTPNYVDALPVKLFEYMAAGIPVIASDFPLWRRIVDEARCGFLVDPLDPGAIAEAMDWILDHPTEAAAMGARGRAAVERRYSWDGEARRLVGMYEALDA